VLTTRRQYREEALPPWPAWGFGERLRVRGFTGAACGLATSALADEILLEGEGQVKALFTVGGNPMMAWPDQQKTFAAMKKLELHVVLDPNMTASARLANYVIAPKLPLEIAGTTLAAEILKSVSIAYGYSSPYAQYVDAAADVPRGADLIEDWEFFYGLAQRMSLQLDISPGVFPTPGVTTPDVRLDMQHKPTSQDMLEIVTRGSFVPYETLRSQPEGFMFEGEEVRVQPGDPASTARLQVGDATMLAELREVATEIRDNDATFSHVLISRRMLHIFNSVRLDSEDLRERYGLNPAFLNPDDMAARNLRKGQLVELQSAHGRIDAVAWPDPGLKAGIVSMSHACGENPDVADDPRRTGANVGRLMSVEVDYDRYSGIPRMSALPVNVVAKSPQA
jgi:anaerobic selenocysteine-containing dehydrogenase